MRFEPRDGNLTLGGIPWMARMVDKARAELEGNLGDYIFPCPRDKRLLARLGLTADEFRHIVAKSPDDEAVLSHIKD